MTQNASDSPDRRKTKIASIQAARGIAAMSVVLFHTQQIQARYFTGGQALPDLLVFGQTGVDLFFVISGFVMVLTTAASHQSLAATFRFAGRRLLRIFPVYWVYFFLVLGVFLLAPSMVNSSQDNRVDLLASFFLWPAKTLPLVPVAWTLSLELWFYAVFSILLLFPKRFLGAFLFVWLVVLIGLNAFGLTPSPDPVANALRHAFGIEFIFGAFAGLAFTRLGRITSLACLFLGLALLVGSALLAGIDTRDVINSILLERALLTGSGYALVVVAVAAMERRESFRFPLILTQLGNWSYSIYLSHVLVLSAMARGWLFLFADETSRGGMIGIWLALTMAAVIVWGWVSYRLFELPALTVSRSITGTARSRVSSATS